MKNLPQKIFGVFLIALSGQPYAATAPSKIIQSSCLLDEALSRIVSISKFRTNLVSEQENYSNGYDAKYYFTHGNNEIGYAEKSGEGAIIYSGEVYPLGSAKVIAKVATEPAEFSPALASWMRLKDSSGTYLCVNFNFDGIGRSGTFQNFKGGYLLDIGSHERTLYYIEGDVRAIRRAMLRQ